MRQILLLAVMSLTATVSPVRAEQDGVASGAPFYEHGSARTDIAAQSDVPRRPALLPFLYGSSIFFQGYDAASTLTRMRAGAVEVNPFMKAITRRPAIFVLVKSGVTAAPIIGAERLWRVRPSCGRWLHGGFPFRLTSSEVSPQVLTTGTWADARGNLPSDALQRDGFRQP